MSLFTVISNYYQKIIELSNLFQDPKLLAAVAQRAVAASDEAMKRLLQTFEVPDAEKLLFLGDPNEGGSPKDLGGAEQQGLEQLLSSVGAEGLANLLGGARGNGAGGGGPGGGRLLAATGVGPPTVS